MYRGYSRRLRSRTQLNIATQHISLDSRSYRFRQTVGAAGAQDVLLSRSAGMRESDVAANMHELRHGYSRGASRQ